MNRRQAIVGGGIGLGAAALGAIIGWQRWQPSAEPVPEVFWSQHLQRPEGGEIALADLRPAPWVLNFWATWCTPCLRELPQIDRFADEYLSKGWRSLALAIDQAEPVRNFLGRLPLKMPVALAGPDGFEWLRMLGNSRSALPYSVIFQAGGAIVWRKLGETSYEELTRVAQGLAR
jgi:thiol-disulfide isomerase/thioredoxin